MNDLAAERVDAYLAEAGSWAADRDALLRSSRRIAWIVAAVAAAIAILEAAALVILTPLKTVEPYTLLVDKQTGFVQLLKPLEPQTITADRALTQSFLVQYVIAREEFDRNAIQADYRKVALWSGGSARTEYLAQVQPSSPSSPLALYPASTVIEVRVKSVSPLSNNRAMVRFDAIRNDPGRQIGIAQPWVAIIGFRYSGAPMTVAERYLNPLGFEVVSYRKNPEALPERTTNDGLPLRTLPVQTAPSGAPAR